MGTGVVLRRKPKAQATPQLPDGWVEVEFEGRFGRHRAEITRGKKAYAPSAYGCHSPACIVPGTHTLEHIYPAASRAACPDHGYFAATCPVCEIERRTNR